MRNDPIRLIEIVKNSGMTLQPSMPWCNATHLMAAVADVESSFGANIAPKYEKVFDFGGKYYDRKLAGGWGAWAACSYSSFQIMFTVAASLGFPGSPIALCDDDAAIHWVIELIQKRILPQKPASVAQFGDAYNSGSLRDSIIPVDYIKKLEAAYAAAPEKHGLKA